MKDMTKNTIFKTLSVNSIIDDFTLETYLWKLTLAYSLVNLVIDEFVSANPQISVVLLDTSTCR